MPSPAGPAAPAPVPAGTVLVAGRAMPGYGRVAFTFDEPVKVSVREAGTVLVVGFARRSAIKGEALAEALPDLVSVVRRDPDGTGLRIALTRPLRTNVLEAGERVFLDLLPENWSGLPPGLPPEVVADLARRAHEAEVGLRRKVPPVAPRAAVLRVAHLPTLLRLLVQLPRDLPADAAPSFAVEDGAARLTLPGAWSLDAAEARGQLGDPVAGLSSEATPDALRLTLRLAPGAGARGFREDDGFVIDVPRTPAHPPPAAAAPPPAVKAPAAAPASASPAPPAAGDAVPAPKALAATPPPPDSIPAPGGPVRPSAETSAGATRVGFTFAGRTPAALFERGGVATLVFETGQTVAAPVLPPGASLALVGSPSRQGAFAVLRFALPEPRPLLHLSPGGDGRTWTLVAGDTGLVPGEPLRVERGFDEEGRTTVLVPVARATGGALWLPPDEGGARIAVVPLAAARPAGLPKRQRFVEFELLPSEQGVAVLALADDVVVRPSLDGVLVGRAGGLTVSPAAVNAAGEPDAAGLALPREAWNEAQRGDVLGRLRARFDAVLDAPRSARSERRLEFAQAFLANGLAVEAVNALAPIPADDPAMAADRRYRLLAGIAALRSGRDAAAAKLFAGGLVADPEARLWRAVLDARAGRRGAALAGFRRSAALMDAYPDDLGADLHATAAKTALEEGDLGYAEAEIAAAASLAAGEDARDGAALLRARLDEMAGRPEAALGAYDRLAANAVRPVAAEATLRGTTLALAQHALTPAAAVTRLETLAVSWRGGDVEARTIAQLARLHAEAGRWREAFALTRRADRLFPEHEATRALHDAMVAQFEDLFLSGRGRVLSRTETLGLYFDFKELTPIGRRGDEIVRRLADHLVELDLLDTAGDLLEHQVQHRLAGAARATVAARLATVRLIDGKPLAALQALQSTHLPDLPAPIKRARALLEARALSDLSRTDLALEVIEDEPGPEVERLRADILWSARRWREAGEAHEALLAERWRGPEPLGDADRADVIRAAIAYGLAEEELGLDRLRAKFAAKMSESADARTFAFLCRPDAAGTRAFRDLARRAAGAETLGAFLRAYRERYPETSVPVPPARPVPTAPEGAPAAEKAADRGTEKPAEKGAAAATPAPETPRRG